MDLECLVGSVMDKSDLSAGCGVVLKYLLEQGISDDIFIGVWFVNSSRLFRVFFS